ncbi:putative membrane protein YgcG [Kribbella aluminosa]|uniref:Membrane protein YgcG n=1 Tax=Kribbella aluminosa TaxID=416017 RepID=A0ABS4UNK7_9ACTN|nr:DUF2207 domain-containing protein [Kribbella aluminosa]MBP2353218.1 putative membrane protein YgcG [Kribbella aluminosa]
MRRALGVVISTLFAVLAMAGFAVTSAGPAGAHPAEYGDKVTNFTIGYTVTTDGVLQVTETIDYQFATTGRHGIYRDLVTREPYADDASKDQEYQVSKIKVSSPDAPSEFSTSTSSRNQGRYETTQIKIGSANDTVKGTRATYTISYEVRGALRHFADHSELYWDATGNGWDATLENVKVTVNVPQGVTKAECFTGKYGAQQTCPSSTVVGGQGVFEATNLTNSDQLTVVAGITAGAVQNDKPIVVNPPSWLERNGLSWLQLIGSGVVTVLALVIAALYAKLGNKDQRFAGMPPGTFPPDGTSAEPVKDDLREDQLPVAFSPPRIPVAEGGLLIDAKATTTETAATLIDMAVRGGVRIDNDGETQKAVLLNPAAATAPHEQALMAGLFPTLQPGSEVVLERGAVGDHTMRNAHDAMIKALRDQVQARQWYLRMPRAGGGSLFKKGFSGACLGMVALWVVGAGLMGVVSAGAGAGLPGRKIVLAVPLIAVVVAIGIWVAIRRRGQRNPAGRAVTDQLVGFRKYLATAEVDQLRFEEGEDIFSKYLPWAIAFGLADRWQKVCEQLVAAGRIPPDPYWYSGPSYYTSGWTAAAVGSTVAHSFDSPPTPSSSGGGGGSSSGFSGGFSGGGGGGGGGGSW